MREERDESTGGRIRLGWAQTAINLAHGIAKYRSEDPYVQVGACIIKRDHSVLLGYNGGPPKINIDWWDRDARRDRVLHAEENVLSSIQYGECKILAVTHLPCKRCVRTIAQKGIKTVYYTHKLVNYNSDETFELSKEFGINIIQMDELK